LFPSILSSLCNYKKSIFLIIKFNKLNNFKLSKKETKIAILIIFFITLAIIIFKIKLFHLISILRLFKIVI